MAARIAKFTVTAHIPDGVSDAAVERYIQDAVKEWCYNITVGWVAGPPGEEHARVPGPFHKIGDGMSVRRA